MAESTTWALGSVCAQAFSADTESGVLRDASVWIAEAYEGDEPPYSVLSLQFYRDPEDDDYVLTVFYE